MSTSTHSPNVTLDQMPSQYGTKYTRILQRQLQVDSAEVEPFFTTMGQLEGKSVSIPEVGKHEMDERTQRHEPVKRNESVFGNRHMKPRSFAHTTVMSADDDLYNNNIDYSIRTILTEDMSAIKRMRTMVQLGVHRDKDASSPTFGLLVKRIFSSLPTDVYTGVAGGLLGTNYVGPGGSLLEDLGDTDTGDSATTNVVPVDFTYTGSPVDTGLTFDKIRRAVQLLKKRLAYVPGVSTCVLAMTSAQRAELERLEVAMNMNYGMGSMKDGITNRILGVTILETESLPVTIIDGKVVQICPMWVKEHAVYGTWMNAKVKVDGDLQDFYDSGQVKTQAALGAARKSKASVMQIMCTDIDLNKIVVP